MTLPIISADQRLSKHRGIKGCIFGKSGIGKTSLLWTLPEDKTLFFDLEAGDLAIEGWGGDTLRPRTWKECRDFAVFIGGPNPALRDDQPYSNKHFEIVCERFGSADALERYNTIFVDSITVAGRLCFSWCKGEPQAFSDKTGKQILMVGNDTLPDPQRFTIAIADKGKDFSMKYILNKKASKNDNGRQTAYNFNNCGGFLFEMKTGKVNSDESVIIISENFLRNRKQLKMEDAIKDELPETVRHKIESEKARKIKRYQAISQVDKTKRIYLFEFEVKNDSALAALAFVTPGKIVYKDFPAAFDSMSTWRVDDGGEFGIEAYKVLAVFERQGLIELVTNWDGEEGFSIEYMVEDGNEFKTIKEGYRYAAPD